MFLNRALLGRTDDGFLILLWKFGGKLDIEQDFINHAV